MWKGLEHNCLYLPTFWPTSYFLCRCLLNCSLPFPAVLPVLVMNCSKAIFPYPVNTAYFKLLSVATTLMQQLVSECSLMSVPPGCGSMLPVLIYQWPHCCTIEIWRFFFVNVLKWIKAGVQEHAPYLLYKAVIFLTPFQWGFKNSLQTQRPPSWRWHKQWTFFLKWHLSDLTLEKKKK